MSIVWAPESVVVDAQGKVYGDGNPALTGTLTGVKNSDPITASYATTAVVGKANGGFRITSVMNVETSKLRIYTVTNTPALLTITPAPLSVVVDAKGKVYGDPNPTLTGTLTREKNSDPITASYATTAVVGSPIGTYPITATLNDLSSKLGNYTVTNTPALLTITPAPLSVTAAPPSHPYAAPNPTLTLQMNGVKISE